MSLPSVRLESLDDACAAIRDMWVRGAPLIGATTAYGMALAVHADPSDSAMAKAHDASCDASDRRKPALGTG